MIDFILGVSVWFITVYVSDYEAKLLLQNLDLAGLSITVHNLLAAPSA